MDNKKYFPGGNTTKGFFSFYNEISDLKDTSQLFTIKGGPGVGKSTFMREIAKKYSSLGYNTNYYHCSSDPDSLDAVKIEGPDILFVDGTSPHIIDPKFPGAFDNIINLSEFFNTRKLQENKEEIINLTKKVSKLFNTSYKYLKALTPIYENLHTMYESALLNEKFESNLKALSKEIINESAGASFSEKKLFLSAITKDGTINFLNETINSKTVYVIKSKVGDLSHLFLKKLKYELERKKISLECFYCPVSPEDKLEHINIPKLDVSIVTSNKYHKYDKNHIEINMDDIYDKNLFDYEIINYDEALIDMLIKRAVYYLGKAKSAHDELEEFYINAMNFDKLNEFTANFFLH